MTIHHAAALALVGWYLLMPPVTSTYQYDDSAPLSEWRQAGSYDTASACEQSRMEALDPMIKHKVKNMSVKDQDWNAALYFAARCIATDDPRLKGN